MIACNEETILLDDEVWGLGRAGHFMTQLNKDQLPMEFTLELRWTLLKDCYQVTYTSDLRDNIFSILTSIKSEFLR
jgi:hypothetical protein